MTEHDYLKAQTVGYLATSEYALREAIINMHVIDKDLAIAIESHARAAHKKVAHSLDLLRESIRISS